MISGETNHVQMNRKEFQIMMFLYSAIQDGWKVKKNAESNTYVFTKKHENKREVFETDYLEKFISNHIFASTQKI